ncbi:MAG: IS630 family transposase [Peptostreptococcaceae bacterium]
MKTTLALKELKRDPQKAINLNKKPLKKMAQLGRTVEKDSDSVLYVMDETGLRTESDNRRTWSQVGVSPVLESNGSHQGLNIIGATEITKKFDTIADIYPASKSITNIEIQAFMESLLELNEGKKVYLVMDNAATHNNAKIQEFWNNHKDRLVLINTPTYSPQLNPQENIWNYLKNKIFTIGARENIDVLYDEVEYLYSQMNEDINLIMSIVNYRNYYLDFPDDWET